MSDDAEQPIDQWTQQEYWSLALRDQRGWRGTWERFTYNGPPGSRRYVVYTPTGYTVETRVPLVVMLHGCAQTPDDAANGTQWNPLADRQGFIVVYPEQALTDNLSSCWNWSDPAHQVRGAGEAGIIAGITQQVMASDTRWRIDPDRVYVTGMSAGAAMAVILGATYPDLYAAIGVHSGLEYRAATGPVAALTAMRQGGPDPLGRGRAAFEAMGTHARLVPTIVFHGTGDLVVDPVNGDQVIEQWMATNRLASAGSYQADFARPSGVNQGQVPGGHAYTVSRWNDTRDNPVQEYWQVTGMGHAWAGGSILGSFTDLRGPDATAALYTFFSTHPRQK